MTKGEDLRLQGGMGPKTGRDQSEKGDKKRAHRHSRVVTGREESIVRHTDREQGRCGNLPQGFQRLCFTGESRAGKLDVHKHRKCVHVGAIL